MIDGVMNRAYHALAERATQEVILGEALRYVDLFSCWIIFGLSGMLLWTYAIGTKRQLILAMGLLAAVIGAFIGAVVIWETGHRTPWAILQRVGHASILLWLWDKRFGFHAQAAKLCDWLQKMPERVKHQFALLRVWWRA